MPITKIVLLVLICSLLGACTPTFYTTATDSYYRGDYDEAIRLYTEAFFPGNILTTEWEATIYTRRGLAYSAKGEYDRAIADHSKAIALNPNFAMAYLYRGHAYRKKGQYHRAIADFDKAIVLSPSFSAAFINRGISFFYMDRFDQAAKDIAKAAQVAPRYALYYSVWSYLAIERQGQDGKAVLKVRVQNLDLKEWPGPLASLYLGDITPEKVIAKTADSNKLQEKANRCTAYFHIGQYYLLQGDKAQAAEMFRKAVATGDTRVIEHAAAREELRRMNRASPNN